jgi:hypothetical protein
VVFLFLFVFFFFFSLLLIISNAELLTQLLNAPSKRKREEVEEVEDVKEAYEVPNIILSFLFHLLSRLLP